MKSIIISTVSIAGLVLALSGCSSEDKDPCHGVTCGENATCQAETGQCACDSGYDMVGEECLNSRQVPCNDAAPDNASSTEEDVTITYSEGSGWTDPADCAWTCDSGYDMVGEECLNSRQVPCNDAAPDNAASTEEDVTITYSEGSGWTDPEDCAWTCDTDYDLQEGSCINSQVLPCNDAAPDNATSISEDVTITYTTADGWTDPADCAWACDTDYDQVGEECLNSRQVPCNDAAPQNATSISADVTITYTAAEGWTDPADCAWACDTGYGQVGEECLDSQLVACLDAPPLNAHTTDDGSMVTVNWDEGAQGWTEPGLCPWECDTDFHEEDGACVANVHIGWCTVQWPLSLDLEYIERPIDFFGQVWVDGQTGQTERLAGIQGKWCYGPAPLPETIDLDALTCVDAEYHIPYGNNDEYWLTYAFELPGEYEYVFAFSGDGGDTWMPCLVESSDPPVPGQASIFGPQNGDLEDWLDDGSGNFSPLAWSWGSDVAVEREEAILHGGLYAARLTRIGSSNSATEFTSSLSPVVAGTEYNIDMWFYDNDNTARGRHITQWYDANMASLGNASYGAFTTDSPDWQLLRRTLVAPADAAYVRVATRVYDSIDGWIILDDVLVHPVAP